MDEYKNKISQILHLNNFLLKLKSNPDKNREEINNIKIELKKLVFLTLSNKSESDI
jgi:hypothetical protein